MKIINTNPNVTVHKYELADDYNCNISLYFDEIGEIINKGGIVLVNCAAGISRSSTIVIAYIMKYYKLDLKNDDNYSLTYKAYNLLDYSEKGTWKLSDDNLYIVFKPNNTNQENKSKILRLKNHEAWVIVNVNNKDVELHLRD